MFAANVTGLVNVPYTNCPAVPPAIDTVTEAPGTSAPVLATTSFTTCEPVFPVRKIRPSEFTVSGEEPTVNCIPTQPVKLLRTLPGLLAVTNGVLPPPPEDVFVNAKLAGVPTPAVLAVTV